METAGVPAVTILRAAELSGSSPASVKRAKQIVTNGIPELQEAAETNQVSIRDSRIYRSSHGTFEDYCKERWGFSRIQAHRMIEAAEVSNVLPMGNKPASERQARPLAKLPAAQQPAAWEKAQEIAKEEGKPVTAKTCRPHRKPPRSRSRGRLTEPAAAARPSFAGAETPAGTDALGVTTWGRRPKHRLTFCQ